MSGDSKEEGEGQAGVGKENLRTDMMPAHCWTATGTDRGIPSRCCSTWPAQYEKGHETCTQLQLTWGFCKQRRTVEGVQVYVQYDSRRHHARS